ncbi:MAG: hypothetical protein EHM23_11105 [Acidobacteria bacterium]|nr:MAG: hypothetical protein EHM23_11105 [Acidobacteriota bacterium]
MAGKNDRSGIPVVVHSDREILGWNVGFRRDTCLYRVSLMDHNLEHQQPLAKQPYGVILVRAASTGSPTCFRSFQPFSKPWE